MRVAGPRFSQDVAPRFEHADTFLVGAFSSGQIGRGFDRAGAMGQGPWKE